MALNAAFGVGLLLIGGLIVWRETHAPRCLNGAGDEPGRPRGGARGRLRLMVALERPHGRAGVGPGRSPGRGSERFRAGPWPGLTPAGGVVLLGCALLLGGGQVVAGDPRLPWPDLPLLAVLAVWPMALATRLVAAPGAASAVCGAYLLPRALVSLVDPNIEPPPLLLVPALAFDVTAWLRASDLAKLSPRQRRVTGGVTRWFYAGGRRRGLAGPRRVGRGRGGLAGAVFGGVLAAIAPAFALLLGADPAAWSGPRVWLSAGATVGACAIVGLATASGRDTAA